MKKILVLICLLGTICLATTGYKDILWGADKSKIKAKYGKDYTEDNESIVYPKFNLDGVTLKMIFTFQNNKLSGWSASGIAENKESEKLVSQYKSKYGSKLENIGSAYMYDDTKGIIAFGSEKLVTGKSIISIACEMK